MRLLLIYDIVHDSQRTKVATACLDYGLDRIQYSAFAGQLTLSQQDELMLRIGQIIGNKPAKIQLIPIDEKSWQKRLLIEQAVAEIRYGEQEASDDDVPRSADE